MVCLQVSRDSLEGGAVLSRMFGIQTMIHVIMDQRALGIDHGFFDRVELLGDVKAGFARLDHLDHGPQMTLGAFQPGDQGRVGCMEMGFCHKQILSPPRG